MHTELDWRELVSLVSLLSRDLGQGEKDVMPPRLIDEMEGE